MTAVRRFIRRPLLLSLLLLGATLLLTLLLVTSRQPPQSSAEAPPQLIVDTLRLAPAEVRFSVSSDGTVRPAQQTHLVSEVQGRVVDVSPVFVLGGQVAAGELLVRVEPVDYQIALSARQAELAKAQAALQEEEALAQVAEREWRQLGRSQIPALGLRQPQLAQQRANVAYAEAAVAKAETDLKRTEIRAPFAAIVSAKAVELGQFVAQGTAIGSLAGSELAEIRLPLTDSQLQTLAYAGADLAALPEVALSSSRGPERSGRVVRLERLVEEQSRFNYLVVQVVAPYQPGALATLDFGRFVSAKLYSHQPQQVIAVPRSSLREGDRLLLVDEKNTLKFQPVDVSYRDAEQAYIRAGVKGGERLVVTPLANPLAGTAVTVRELAQLEHSDAH